MGFSKCIDTILDWTVQLVSCTVQFSYWWTGQLTGQLLVDCTADMSVTGKLVS